MYHVCLLTRKMIHLLHCEDVFHIWTLWRQLTLKFETLQFEISGKVTNDATVVVHMPEDVDEECVAVPPETSDCSLAWHTHPTIRCLVPPEDDVFFHPPSAPDTFYLLLAAFRGLYGSCAVVSIEGVYSYSVNTNSPKFAILEHELHELQCDRWDTLGEWGLPAEPILVEGGYTGCTGAENLPHMLGRLLCSVDDSMFMYHTHQEAWDGYKTFYESIVGDLVSFEFTPKEQLCNYSEPIPLNELPAHASGLVYTSGP